jgi:hypothetical protein
LRRAQATQKQWYDQTAYEHTFEAGEQVLVLLPTSTSKLLAQWQGPYEVVKPVGKVNYLVDMCGRRKRKRVFHVNMLRKWHVQSSTNYLCEEVAEDMEEVPGWNDGVEGEAKVGEQLTREQNKELEELLAEFGDVFQKYPGYTDLAEHSVKVGDAPPIRLSPYRLPHAYHDIVQDEIQDIFVA